MEGVAEQQISFDPKKVLIVPTESVRPNSWNPKDKDSKDYQKVLASIRRNGLKDTIKVREKLGANPNDLYEIIDGEQRWKSCKELGYPLVAIYNEGELSDIRAKELTVWWQQQVPFNEVDLAHLITELVKSEEVYLPYDKEEVDTFLRMAKFNIDDFKEAPIPEISPNLLKTLMIQMTNEQYEIVMKAMNKVKETSEVKDISDARIIELICIEFINMPEGTTGLNQT